MHKIGDHAVVLGASMSGLLAARVLADAYQRVTVIDRDPLPERAADRKGVPRGRHAHALLARGAQILDELFPGIRWPTWRRPGCRSSVICGSCGSRSGGTCCAGTASPAASPATRFTSPAGPIWKARSAPGSGPCPMFWIKDRCEVAGLVHAPPARDHVTGARVRPGGGAEEEIAADLVVDATGRGGRTPAWLAGMGYGPPAEEQIRVDVKYASCHLRLRPGALGETKLVLIGAEPARPTALALFAQEEDRWILTLAGYAWRSPPGRPGRVPGLRPQPRPAARIRRHPRRQPAG